ncbi:MAG: phosphoenolpyruvate carboxykinase (ATP) [Acidobacteriota bacterium]
MTGRSEAEKPSRIPPDKGVIASTIHGLPVVARGVDARPSPERLRALTERMSSSRVTRFGGVSVRTRVTCRSASSTFIVTDEPGRHRGHATISRAIGERIARRQDEYIRTRDVLAIDGRIGNDPSSSVPARLIVEASSPHIAAMQQILYFPPGVRAAGPFEPALTVIVTPGLTAPGFPDERLIAVDLEQNVTRVFNTDYFGESRRGGLRMWSRIVYERGGLPLRGGCKIVPAAGRERVFLILGRSGTGKTTTTFARHSGSRAIQDDFVALMPDGRVHPTENGGLARTAGLSREGEAAIRRAVLRPTTYLENVPLRDGEVDFSGGGAAGGGRAIFRLADVEPSVEAAPVDGADVLLILNSDESVIPAVARLTGAQAAAYFTLGETRRTGAGAAGRTLRLPGANPFFPLDLALQGNRFLHILRNSPMEVYLMNTGRIGGGEEDGRGRKVGLRHCSAIIEGIAGGTIYWERDPDFGYDLARLVPGLGGEDECLLHPRAHYARQGRIDEYRRIVGRLKFERREYLRSLGSLDREILDAVG